ncbi:MULTISPECIES: DeoR/GlpR family DNA-binding transcription regulator [unclassified Agarivorans]|uniref:DeoR/GlpR family DNA-binding transcription regulator n=1 Tax=unclassified Agarivorans TaxID=2636026 RepID=UPI003D7DD0F9
MSAKDRIQSIKQMVTNDKKVTVVNLSTIFKVTEETIRRDLEKLEMQGFITRTYGGAVLNANGIIDNVHFYKRTKSLHEEKQTIALKAQSCLENVTTLAADSSTTVMEFLKLLRDRSDITIMTNSAEAIHELATAEVNLVSTGGELNKTSLSMQGVMTKEAISKHHVDIMVMSCKGLDMQSGALDSTAAEADVKKAMIKQASEVVLLVDHSKFERKAFVKLVNFDNINYIVTDKSPGNKWIEFCDKNNIKLIF